ncbi:MAG: tetratricopeptide repeat protein [Phycisphaerae bacterium]|nr:tetratricopeptide repeat protein [Phycisphaerae bacterium]
MPDVPDANPDGKPNTSSGDASAGARWTRMSDLFGDAIELPSDRRAAFIEQLARSDTTLSAELDRLLRFHAAAGAFLEPPIAASLQLGAGLDAPHAFVGRTIDGYRILRTIATGGMGVVFEAEQESPARRVALKFVHPGLASRALSQRLVREGAALARLRHPGIAQIFAVGNGDVDGTPFPYLVMELVDGKPLNEVAADPTLGTRARVAMLIAIAEAVQHAQEKGVIHRDLKPSNVLGAPDGRPRVLDFGVARLLDADSPLSMATMPGMLVGTLRYMSPEQFGDGSGGGSGEVDTRSDIYSLGVMAYELLSGRLPFDAPSGSIAETIRVIVECEPPPLRRFAPSVGRDLECIVMKAIDRDRNRRYSSAGALAADFQRFLDGEPIEARPATTAYQLTRFAARHRGVVAGIAATLLVLLLGLVLYAGEADRAHREALRATDAANTSQAVSDFMVRMMARVDPNRGGSVDIRALVRGALDDIAPSFEAQPIQAAAVHNEMGTIFYNLRDYESAAQEYEIALRLRDAALGPNAEASLDSVNALGQTKAQLGHHDEATALYRRALDGRRSLLGEDAPKTLIVRSNMAVALPVEGKHAEAEAMLREVLASQERTLGDGAKATLITMGNIASACRRDRRYEEAYELRCTCYERFLALNGRDHAMTAIAENAVAQSLHDLGRLSESDDRFRAARDGLARTLGPDHRDTAVAENNWGELLVDARRFDEAVPHFVAARAIHERISGPDHRVTLAIINRQASALAAGGRRAEAAELYHELVERSGRTFGPSHGRTIDVALSEAEAIAPPLSRLRKRCWYYSKRRQPLSRLAPSNARRERHASFIPPNERIAAEPSLSER